VVAYWPKGFDGENIEKTKKNGLIKRALKVSRDQKRFLNAHETVSEVL